MTNTEIQLDGAYFLPNTAIISYSIQFPPNALNLGRLTTSKTFLDEDKLMLFT